MSKQDEDLEDVKDDKKKKKDKSVVQTKIIVRHLPVGMTKALFLEIFEPLPEHDFFRFVNGDRSLAPFNYPRAYINFLKVEDILEFCNDYDGSEIKLESGRKSICVVEYAPFQKVPKKGRKKEDLKVNTIEKDADYIKFLETLEQEEEKETIDVEKFLEELDLRDKQNQKPVETPLTEFVKQRREDRKRIREERRKQDVERRKKKDEERRKRREADRKKKMELERNKKRDKNEGEVDSKKKTLGETKREMQENNKLRQNSAANDDGRNKIKLLQKKGGDENSNKSKVFKEGVFTADELERSWADDYVDEWPDLSQNEDGDEKISNRNRDSHQRHPAREFSHRKWKEDHRPVSGRNKEKPDREIYYPGSGRGGRGGYRGGGRGIRPQKYSEQRNHRPSENEK